MLVSAVFHTCSLFSLNFSPPTPLIGLYFFIRETDITGKKSLLDPPRESFQRNMLLSHSR